MAATAKSEIVQTVPLPSSAVAAALQHARRGHAPLSLLAYHRDGAELVELPAGSSLIIGRAPPADVQIDDESLSRSHARFTCVADDTVRVDDLGSLNGTWLRGERVVQAEPRVGDEVVLGRVIVAICQHTPAAGALHGLMSHERLRVALEEEVVRAQYFGRSAAMLLVRAARGERVHVSRWLGRVQALLRPVDKMALYSLDAVAILLPEATMTTALELARTLTAPREGEAPLLAGVAASPETATSAEKLLEGCWTAAQNASPGRPVQAAPCGPWTLGGASSNRSPDEAPVAVSPVMQKIYASVARLARSSIPVLLHGETGTGKEVIARSLHDLSPRSARPMVCVNCGAIPQQLVESTLFGHERGAFTGASQQQKGIFESADGGTVFLDEVGELPAAAQAALLRVLETKRVTRVGSTKEIDLDVRLIAATHRDLEAMSETGGFRVDLLYRLNTMTLTIPPLRERPEDIEPLARRFLTEANEANGSRIQGIESEALALMQSYTWSGNVRELRNAIERAVVIAEGEWISVEDLPERVRASPRRITRSIENAEDAADSAGEAGAPSESGSMRARMQHYEAQLIVEALRGSHWNQTEAARNLGMPLRTLVHRMKILGIKKLGFSAPE